MKSKIFFLIFINSSAFAALGDKNSDGYIGCENPKKLVATKLESTVNPYPYSINYASTEVPSPNAKSSTNGRSNTFAILMQSQNFSAAQACYNLVRGGYQDWYLPAIDELKCLQKNKSYLSSLGLSANFLLSSTEAPKNTTTLKFDRAYGLSWFNGTIGPGNKSTKFDSIVCVRSFQ